jgi:hypothetical protein
MIKGRIVVFLFLVAFIRQSEGFGNHKPSRRQKTKNSSKGKPVGGFGSSSKSAPLEKYTPDESASTENLELFLISQECEGTGGGFLEIGYSSKMGTRGLFAKEAFDQGEFLCAIPFPAALVIEQQETDSLTDAHRGLNFIRKVTQNEEVSANWAPYLDTLPTKSSNFDPTPDFFSDEEIRQLEFPRIVKAAIERKHQIEELSKVEGVDLDALQFATWIVKSRAFSVLKVKREEGKVYTKNVLIPYFDMINHSSDQSNVKLEVVETKAEDESFYALCATQPIPAGQEILLSYGSGEDSAVELLLNYGFVPSANPNDVAMLEYGGDGCLTDADQWSTTLEEDDVLAQGASGNLRTILAFRIRLKQALQAIRARRS